jgi:hypothetical protein
MQVVLFDILPMRVLPPLFFVAIAYPMIGLRPLGLYWAKTLLVSAWMPAFLTDVLPRNG